MLNTPLHSLHSTLLYPPKVLNTPFLKIALVQHTFTCVLPMPRPEGDLVGAVFPWQCLWRTPMLYDQQLGLLLLLQRITEHFAASTLSVDHTHALDAVRMVVPACIACIADCVMRQIATDKPSRVCVHLRGTHERRGFTIGSAELAKQSGAVPVHTPELNTARTCALDYFAAQAARLYLLWLYLLWLYLLCRRRPMARDAGSWLTLTLTR